VQFTAFSLISNFDFTIHRRNAHLRDQGRLKGEPMVRRVPAMYFEHDPEAPIDPAATSRQLAAVSRSLVVESRWRAALTRRQLKETYQKVRDSFIYLSGADESFQKLTGFLKGGAGCAVISAATIHPHR
jgi:hypothetical protein